MNSRVLITAAFMAVAGLVRCSATPTPTTSDVTKVLLSSQEEAAVRRTLAALDSSWNRHDIKAMEALLTKDVQWIVTNGNCWRGKQAVCEAYEVLHQHLVANAPKAPLSTVHTTNVEVQILTPQIAMGMATLQFGDGSNVSDQDGPGWHTRASFVMIKEDGNWKIAQFHQTMLDPRIEREDPLWGDAALRRE